MRASHPRGTTIAAIVFVGLFASACRLNPECFGTNECGDNLICYRGACTEPSLTPFADGGARDVGTPDAGAIPDGGFVDCGIPTFTWYDDVLPIVESRCWACHSVPLQNGAPRPLQSYEDTQLFSQSTRVYELMAARVQDPLSPMPPVGNPPLNPSQIGVIRIWASECAPAGEAPALPDSGWDGGTPDSGFRPDAEPLPDAANPLEGVMAAQPRGAQQAFIFLEGPTWRAADSVVLFSDINANTIYQLAPPDTVTVFRNPSGNSNGLGTDLNGDLLAAEHGGRRIARSTGAGPVVNVVDNFNGAMLNSPNDLVVRSDGTIYFTDPPYGLEGRPRELDFNGLFRLPPGAAQPIAEWRGTISSRPNGLTFSPNESILYMTDTAASTVYQYDVNANGTLANRRFFVVTAQTADGLAPDVEGNIYVASSAGIEVFRPQGVRWGVIPIPGAAPNTASNLVFGGKDRRTLYVTAGSALWSVQVTIPGAF